MGSQIVAIIIVVVLSLIFIVLTIFNRKIEEPAGCEEMRAEACGACNLAEKCKVKK